MTTSEYHTFVTTMWRSRGAESDLFVMSLGLGGETGETLELLKKSVRDQRLDLEELKLEMGDVLYYLTRLCNYYGFTLDELMEKNVAKLQHRKLHGKTVG